MWFETPLARHAGDDSDVHDHRAGGGQHHQQHYHHHHHHHHHHKVGNITNSMALVADSFHMLSDVIALLIAYVSVSISPKEWKQNTFGWARAEVSLFWGL